MKAGIVGCFGDLGSQLAERHLQAGIEVVGFDTRQIDSAAFRTVATLSQLQKHWCAPADTIATFTKESHLGRIVLHDSVMSNSLNARAIVAPKTKRGIDIAHMLMNGDNMMVHIAEESDDPAGLESLFGSLGFETNVISVKDHDSLMAQSQAIYAIIHELVDLEMLVQARNLGFLPPSGKELVSALEHRAAIWTPATRRSLMKNPHIRPMLERALGMIEGIN